MAQWRKEAFLRELGAVKRELQENMQNMQREAETHAPPDVIAFSPEQKHSELQELPLGLRMRMEANGLAQDALEKLNQPYFRDKQELAEITDALSEAVERIPELWKLDNLLSGVQTVAPAAATLRFPG